MQHSIATRRACLHMVYLFARFVTSWSSTSAHNLLVVCRPSQVGSSVQTLSSLQKHVFYVALFALVVLTWYALQQPCIWHYNPKRLKLSIIGSLFWATALVRARLYMYQSNSWQPENLQNIVPKPRTALRNADPSKCNELIPIFHQYFARTAVPGFIWEHSKRNIS